MKTLIFSPHIDDEVIMCGGRMILHKKIKEEVFIVYLTLPKNKDEEIRRKKESAEVLEYCKIPQKNTIYFNFKELTLLNNILKCYRKIELHLRKFNPDKIFIPAYEGGHIDHDLVNFLVSKAFYNLKSNSSLFEVPLYSPFFLRPGRILDKIFRRATKNKLCLPPNFINKRGKVMRLHLSKKDIEEKKKLIGLYKSQKSLNLCGQYGFDDIFRVYKLYDYTKPPYIYCKNMGTGNVSFEEFKNKIKVLL